MYIYIPSEEKSKLVISNVCIWTCISMILLEALVLSQHHVRWSMITHHLTLPFSFSPFWSRETGRFTSASSTSQSLFANYMFGISLPGHIRHRSLEAMPLAGRSYFPIGRWLNYLGRPQTSSLWHLNNEQIWNPALEHFGTSIMIAGGPKTGETARNRTFNYLLLSFLQCYGVLP